MAAPSIDDLVARVSREAERRRAAVAEQPSHAQVPWSALADKAAPGEPPALRIAAIAFEAPFSAHARPTYRLEEFLVLHGPQFVNAAYLGILGRSPDAAGASHYLAQLQQGASKVEILARLRYSAEGRQRAADVPGLTRAYALHALGRIPLLGYFVRIATGILALPRLQRQVREVEQFAAGRDEVIAAHWQQGWTAAARAMDAQQQATKAELASTFARLAELRATIERLEARVQSVAASQRNDGAELMAVVAKNRDELEQLIAKGK